MIVVIDASAAVKLILDEEKSDVARREWDRADDVIAPTVVVPEVAAAITAALRDHRIGEDGAARAHATWVELAGSIGLRVVDEGLSEQARQVAERDAGRGMDAIYIAVARELATSQSPVGLLSFDVRQRSAPIGEGVELRPGDDEN